MDIAFPANRRRITEPCCNPLDCGPEITFCLCGTVEALQLPECHRCQDCSGPSAKVFRGDIPTGNLPQIIIYIIRGDVLWLTHFVKVLKQFLTRQLLAGPDNLCDAAILDAQRPSLAAFALELEPDLRTLDRCMAIFECRQTVAVVLLGIVVIS